MISIAEKCDSLPIERMISLIKKWAIHLIGKFEGVGKWNAFGQLFLLSHQASDFNLGWLTLWQLIVCEVFRFFFCVLIFVIFVL